MTPPQPGETAVIDAQFTVNAPAIAIGQLDLAGVLNVGGDSSIQQVNITGAGQLNSSGGVRKTLTIGGGLDFDGAQLFFHTVLVPGATMQWRSGMVWGNLTVPSGALLLISGAKDKSVNDATFELNGGVRWADNGRILHVGFTDGTVTFNNRGNFAAEGGGTVEGTGLLHFRFNNEGNFIKTGAGTTMSFGVPTSSQTRPMNFVNTGTIDAQSGTLDFPLCTLTLDDKSTVKGAGLVRISGGVLYLPPAKVVTVTGHIELAGGHMEGDGQIIGEGGIFDWTGGSIGTIQGPFTSQNPATLNVPAGMTVNIFGTADKRFGAPDSTSSVSPRQHGVIKNAGTINWSGTGDMFANVGGGGGEIINSGTMNVLNNEPLRGEGLLTNLGTGTIRKTSGGSTPVTAGFGFVNSGIVDVQNGAIAVDGGLTLLEGGTVSGAGRIVNTGNMHMTGTTTMVGEGTVELRAGILRTGSAEVPSGTIKTTGQGKFSWTGGTLSFTVDLAPDSRMLISGDADKNLGYYFHRFFADGGTLNNRGGHITWTGSGAILEGHGGTINNEGTFDIETSALMQGNFINSGTLEIGAPIGLHTYARNSNPPSGFAGGTYALQPKGTLNLDIGGPAPEEFDRIVASAVTLGGRLNVRFVNGYKPASGASFSIITGANGQFTSITTPFDHDVRAEYSDGTVTLVAASLIRLSGPTDRISVPEGSTVPITVEVDSTVKEVRFYDNGQLLGSDATAPFQFNASGLSAGLHFISAVASTSGGSQGASSVRVFVDPANGKTYRFTGAGDWSNPANWTPLGVPGPTDSAVIEGKDVSGLAAQTVRALALDGGTLSGPGEITVTENAAWLSGTLSGLTLTIPERATCSLLTEEVKTFRQVAINNRGTVIVTGLGSESDAGTELVNTGELVIDSLHFTTNLLGDTGAAQGSTAGVSPDGFWDWLFPPKPTKAKIGKVTNKGKVIIKGTLATSSFAQQRGHLQLGGLRIVPLIGNDGSTLIGNDGASLVGLDGNTIKAPGAASLESGGGGSTAAQAVNSLVTLEGGTISGYGRIGGDVVNSGGFMSPGGSPGMIEINGNYTQGAGGTLLLEIGGTNTTDLNFDKLVISGNAGLGGSLILRTINNYTPNGTPVVQLTYASVSGQFAQVSSNAQTTFSASGMSTVASGANPPAPKALNISTRMRVETGDNVLIAGFIVTGDQPKRVLIRGIGPSLPVGGALADPILELDGGAIVNDDWKASQEQEIRDTTIPPTSDLESAIVATLPPGGHTAILRGKANGTGVGLVEVYDLESGAPAQLANISTRGQVQTDDNVMIGGFIIAGDYPAKVLLRAIGPSLTITGKLQDPTLELVDGQGNTISNDNWRATQELEITATTVPPTNDNEAAIVATLVPGFYTAIVRGKNNTTGVALVEGYNIQ